MMRDVIPATRAHVLAVVRPIVDARPVRYTIEELSSYIDNRLALRKSPMTVAKAGRWAARFVDDKIDSDHPGPQGIPAEIQRTITRNNNRIDK